LVCQGVPYAVTIRLTVQSVLTVGIVDNPLTKIMESQKSIDNSQREKRVSRLVSQPGRIAAQMGRTLNGRTNGPHLPFGVPLHSIFWALKSVVFRPKETVARPGQQKKGII